MMSRRTVKLGMMAGCIAIGAGLPGCGGGCSGASGAKDLLDRLPAKADMVMLMAVDDFLDKASRKALMAEMEKLIVAETGGEAAPAWVADVERVAIVGTWPSTDAAGAGADACGPAVDKAWAMLTKNLKGAPESLRRELEEGCKGDPKVADCLNQASAPGAIAECMAGGRPGGGPQPQLAAALVGSFDAAAALKSIKDKAPGGEAADGLDFVTPKFAATVLGTGALGIGMPAALSGLKASWAGTGDTIRKNTRMMGALEKVDLGHSVVIGAYGLDQLGAEMPLSDVAAAYNLRGGLSVKAWFKASSAVLDQVKAGVAMAKAAIAMMPKSQLGQVSAQTGMSRAQVEELFDGVKQLVDSLDVSIADGAATVTAKSDLDASAFVKSVFNSISLPAFKKYLARAKTAEAIDNLDKIYKGAAVYFAEPKVAPSGIMLDCQFPKTVACTPTAPPCKGNGQAGRYAPDKATWNQETWAALQFSINSEHYFQYCFESSGTGASAVFTVTAHADLDCDGELSTFQRMGTGVQEGRECSLGQLGSSGIVKVNEAE